jgi:glutamate/aspartate transport system substrate-binding protein
MMDDPLSFDRYGIAFARDDAPLRAVVVDALRALAASGEIRQTYDKWFLRPLGNGMRLGLPMGEALKRCFEMLGQPPE